MYQFNCLPDFYQYWLYNRFEGAYAEILNVSVRNFGNTDSSALPRDAERSQEYSWIAIGRVTVIPRRKPIVSTRNTISKRNWGSESSARSPVFAGFRLAVLFRVPRLNISVKGKRCHGISVIQTEATRLRRTLFSKKTFDERLRNCINGLDYICGRMGRRARNAAGNLIFRQRCTWIFIFPWTMNAAVCSIIYTSFHLECNNKINTSMNIDTNKEMNNSSELQTYLN